MSIDERRFEAAREKVIGGGKVQQGIGTLSEKTVHAVLKNYYAPDTDMHEIPIENFVADIYTGSVTIVYPIPHEKWLRWMDEETGELSVKRKSPKHGNPYQAFIELYKIRPYLSDPNLKFRFALLDMEEYRLLNGWSKDKKKGSERYDRIPMKFVEEVCIDRREDYMQFIPYEIKEPFTTKDFAKSAKIPARLAGTVLLILYDLGIVARTGKQGNSYLYEICEI